MCDSESKLYNIDNVGKNYLPQGGIVADQDHLACSSSVSTSQRTRK